MIKLSSLTFGTDAEFFLRTLNGTSIPVCGIYGGTKDAPVAIKGCPDGFTVQEDNAAVEFNVPPSHTMTKLAHDVILASQELQVLLPKALIFDKQYSSIVLAEEYLQIPALQRFGCEPDYCVWSMKTNERPIPKVPGFRSAAAHVHIGWDNPEDEDKLQLVRLCDIFAVLPKIPSETKDESDRRTLYGKAGSFRWKEYGIEHRVLSNKWCLTKHSIYSTIKGYLLAVLALNLGVVIDEDDVPNIVKSINDPQPTLATQIYQKYSDKLVQKVSQSGISINDYLAQFC